MKYELDQSIRIEETNKDTIIGLANTKEYYALIVPRSVKKSLQARFSTQGLRKQYMILVFAAAVISAIEASRFHVTDLVIDIEYPGYEGKIIHYLRQYFNGTIEVYFSLVGKHSPAHLAAYGVHTKKRKASGVISEKELLNVHKKMAGAIFRT